jgi:hypothetical protein
MTTLLVAAPADEEWPSLPAKGQLAAASRTPLNAAAKDFTPPTRGAGSDANSVTGVTQPGLPADVAPFVPQPEADAQLPYTPYIPQAPPPGYLPTPQVRCPLLNTMFQSCVAGVNTLCPVFGRFLRPRSVAGLRARA